MSSCRESSGTGREARLEKIVCDYLVAMEEGVAVGRDQLLRAHPEFREELTEFFLGHDQLLGINAFSTRGDAEVVLPSHEPSVQPLRQRKGNVGGAGFSDHPSTLGQLGEFQLIREIGRGGMGVVYEAFQLSLRRRVALKVLPFASAIDPKHLQRFKNEALAAAHLRHPGIVPVYAVGADLGVHFYAMQFIEGQSLAALIAELRREQSESDFSSISLSSATLDQQPMQGRNTRGSDTIKSFGNSRTTDTVVGSSRPDARSSYPAESISRDQSLAARTYINWLAGLGRQAAEALEYSHQMGIVHRDIKPANLLLDPRGQLWVTDFGLAQITGDTGLTVSGELLGTLRYASPEQAHARPGLIDHRTDIYSLGATLYELLTLQPIFEGRDRNALLKLIADTDPVPPRAIQPSIPVELETILLKALAKDPADRYSSAQLMAEDLQRLVENRPILARRPTLAERFRKWTQRHPSVVIASVTALTFISIACVVFMILFRVQQSKVEQAFLRECVRANEAEQQFLLARRSVNELLRVSEEELVDRPGTESLRRRLLMSVLNYYQEFIEQRLGDLGTQERLNEARIRVQRILSDLAVLRASSQLQLLEQDTVLDELGLGEEQRDKVTKFSKRVAKQRRDLINGLGRIPASQRSQIAIEQARGNEAEVRTLLSPQQETRLFQIALQTRVPEVFRDPDVANVIMLTDDQKERIRMIEEEGFLRMLNSMSSNKKENTNAPEEPRTRSDRDRILDLLTPLQLESWHQLTGAPIQNPIHPAFPF